MDRNLQVRQGGQLDLQVRQGHEDATSVTFYMKNQDDGTMYEVTDIYVDGLANITLTSVQTSVLGVYDYQVNENIPNEDPIKYPDPNGCSDCGLPTITVCEAIDMLVS